MALDFKRADVEALADGELAASFINGAIRTSEQQEMAELLRRKSGAVVAFGSCAWLGGIPGLANLYSREEILERVYREVPSLANDEGTMPEEDTDVPEGHLTLPAFSDSVRTLDQVVDVDYYLPGCPPPVHLIRAAVMALVEGTLPAKGTVLAPDVALCSECPRAATKPQKPQIKAFRRPHEMVADPDLCLLAQGLMCLGPATRAGCGSVCIGANMPCTGCMGPTSRVRRPRREGAVGDRVADRRHRGGGDRGARPGDRRPGRHVLPLQPARLAAASARRRAGRRGRNRAMSKKILIDPITRLEGHGKIHIFLDDAGSG